MASEEDKAFGSLNGQTTSLVITSMLSITFYTIIDLHFQIFTTFKNFRSLYFWAVLVGTWGIAFNAVGYLLRHHKVISSLYITSTIIITGWYAMITGQSLVLYSRLHLIMLNDKVLRAVLIMIIVDAVWLYIPGTVLHFGVNSPKARLFEPTYIIYERVQLSVFFIQEVTISGLYLWQTRRFLHLEAAIGNTKTKRTMMHLIYVNILVILLDITLIALEFGNLYGIQMAWKPLAYATKLKIEFSVLNKLVDLIRRPMNGNYHSRSRVTAQIHNEVALEDFGPQNVMGGTGHTRCETYVESGDWENQEGQEHHQKSSVLRATKASIHRSDGVPEEVGSLESGLTAGGEAAIMDREGCCVSDACSEAPITNCMS